MGDFRADLHCHSTFSDGTLSPKEIIHLASEIGLQGIAITDHDTIDSYEDALPFAEEKKISLITGVEFSAVHKKESVHILAYAFPPSCSILKEFCSKHTLRRQQRNHAILEQLSVHGMPLSEKDLPFETASLKHQLGRPHIALAMLQKGYVHSIQQAFHDYIGEGKPCYVQGNFFTVDETLDYIHQAKGLAIIAHPHLIENVLILRNLLEMPFDGIEGYYARFPKTAEERWIKIGKNKKWIITGGSDFHGEIKPNNPLGSSWVNEETFQILQSHFKSHS